MRWLLASLIALAVLSSCNDKIVEGIQPDAEDSCSGISCGLGSVCSNGAGVCPSDTRLCNNACIPSADCCADEDCESGSECKANKCVAREKPCNYLESWNEETGSCDCSENSQWCASQGACIPKTACCNSGQCRNNYKCSDTKITVKICFKNVFEQCKTLLKGVEDKFSLPEEHIVRIDRVLANGTIEGYIDGNRINDVITGSAREISNGTIMIAESISTVGGVCKQQPK